MPGTLKLNSGGAGNLILTPSGSVGSDVTVTLPAATATLLTNKTAGTVLQMVSALYSTETTTSSSSFVTTGISASITPSATSSKIAVFMTVGDTGTNEATSGVTLGLFRNGSQIGAKLSQRHCYVDTSATEVYIINQWASCYVDSPSSTSSLTYSIQFNNAGAGTVKVMRDNTQGSLILMEIAG